MTPAPKTYRCACGTLITAYPIPELIAHALRVHYDTPEHRLWANTRPEAPHFEVRVAGRSA